jgi:hypothetical protein
MNQANGQDSLLAYQAILDLADANLTPTDAAGDWDTAIMFSEHERQDELVVQEIVDTVMDAISEQA